MVNIGMTGSSIQIKLSFPDIFKKLKYIQNEDGKVVEAGLVKLSPSVDLSETFEIFAVYENNKLIIGTGNDKIEPNYKVMCAYSDRKTEGIIYALLKPSGGKSDDGKTIIALYSDRL